PVRLAVRGAGHDPGRGRARLPFRGRTCRAARAGPAAPRPPRRPGRAGPGAGRPRGLGRAPADPLPGGPPGVPGRLARRLAPPRPRPGRPPLPRTPRCCGPATATLGPNFNAFPFPQEAAPMLRWHRWPVFILAAALVPTPAPAQEPAGKDGEKWLLDRSLTV